MTSRDDKFASQLERIDERIADGEGLHQESDLDGAGKVLNLIHQVRARGRDTDAADEVGSTRAANETCGETNKAPEITGQQIGSYIIDEQIARGGMGVVFRAHDTMLSRTVALKMMLAGPFANAEERERFCLEAEAAARLDHVGIVPIYDVGQHQGQPYFTMKFVDGESLAERLRRDPIDSHDAAGIARQIAQAVEYAHQQRVIHRDIKPSNVLLSTDGQVKLTDFGLARQTDSDRGLTATAQVLGTPSYMSPEQAAGFAGSAGPLVDVYAIGATLYCMLTGRPPFQASSPAETIRLVIDQDPIAPIELTPSVPRDLNTICLECLQKEPQRRYPNAGELAADLRRFLDHEPIAARPVGTSERLWKWAKKHPAVAGLSMTALTALAAILIGGAVYQSMLNTTLKQLGDSRTEAVDNLYRSLTSEAEYLVDARPAGFGQRVEGLIAEALTLDSQQKDLFKLRQLAVGGMGYVGAREHQSFPAVNGIVRSANVISETGVLIVGLQNGEVAAFDIATKSKIQELRVIEDPIVRIDVDGLMGGSRDNRVRIIGQHGKQIATIAMHDQRTMVVESVFEPKLPDDFLGLEVTPDGRHLIGVQSPTPEMLDPRFWLSRSTYQHGDQVIEGRRTPSESAPRHFAIVRLGESEGSVDPLPIKVLPIEISTRFDVNKHYLAVGRSWLDGAPVDDSVDVYDFRTGEIDRSLNTTCGALLNVRISRNGYYVAAGSQHGFEVFERSGKRLARNDEIGGSLIECFPGTGAEVLVRTDRSVDWFSPDIRRPVTTFRSDKNAEAALVPQISSDRRHLIWTGSNQTQLLDIRGTHHVRIPAHSGIAKSASFSRDGRLFVSSTRYHGGNHSRVWNTGSGELIFDFVGAESEFSPDGKWIAAWSAGKMNLWNVSDGTLAASAEFVPFPQSIRFSKTGDRMVAASHIPGDFEAWEIEETESDSTSGSAPLVRLVSILTHETASCPIAMSPTGARVAYSSNGKIRVVDLSGQDDEIEIDPLGSLRMDAVDFLDDQRVMVVAGKLRIWDLPTRELVWASERRHHPPLTFSPDRRHLLCRRSILSTETMGKVFELPALIGAVACSDWSPDGRRIALGSDSGEMTTWNLDRIQETLVTYGLPADDFCFAEPLKDPSTTQMMQIGAQNAGAIAPRQWLQRYDNLQREIDRDAEAKFIGREVQWLTERIGLITTRPFFQEDKSQAGTLDRMNKVYALATRLQKFGLNDSELNLIMATLDVFESIDRPSPETIRAAARLYHTVGDVSNFFEPNTERCMEAYLTEEALLDQLAKNADPAALAEFTDSRYWLNRNLAIALHRQGDKRQAIERMSVAIRISDQVEDLGVGPEILSRAHEMRKEWQSDLSETVEQQ